MFHRRQLPSSFTAVTICFVGVFAMTACGDSGSSGNSAKLLGKMRKAGTAKIALAELPPLEYLSPSGEPQGYLVDLIRGVLKDLGVAKIEPSITTFDAMIPALQARKFDLLPGGLNITAPRCNVVVFAGPVTMQREGLYVRPGNPKRLTNYRALAKAGNVKVALLSGSAQEAFALQNKVPKSRMVTVPDVQAGIAAVTGGRADAFGVGQFSIQDPGKKGLEVVVDNASPYSGIGIAFRKEDAGTRDAFDKVLAQWRGDGRLARLYAKWGYTNGDQLIKTTAPAAVAPKCT
jgi:polar amino acid transport system substrate-binding protein